MAAAGAAVGTVALLDPGRLAAAYKMPADPYRKQLLRELGTRILALSAWAATAKTDEERNRALSIIAALSAVDTATAALNARGIGPAGRRTAISSAIFGLAALGVRSLRS